MHSGKNHTKLLMSGTLGMRTKDRGEGRETGFILYFLNVLSHSCIILTKSFFKTCVRFYLKIYNFVNQRI